MSLATRTAAMLGAGATLAVALTGTAHAAQPVHKTGAQQAKAICYVYVYSSKNFKGQAACLSKSIKNLKGWTWQNGTKVDNSISSIDMDRACTVTLYRDANYKGKKSVWKRNAPRPGKWRSDANLANNAVGDNKTSSIKIQCAFDT